jgi:hypothetical protein
MDTEEQRRLAEYQTQVRTHNDFPEQNKDVSQIACEKDMKRVVAMNLIRTGPIEPHDWKPSMRKTYKEPVQLLSV